MRDGEYESRKNHTFFGGPLGRYSLEQTFHVTFVKFLVSAWDIVSYEIVTPYNVITR